ncbi:MAG: protein translocase subunit SecD [Pirellulales bacterium]
MSRLKAFRSHAPWAACLSFLLATCLTWSTSVVAQEAADDQPVPAEVQPAPADAAPTDTVPPAGAASDAAEQPPVDTAPTEKPADATKTDAPDAPSPKSDAPTTSEPPKAEPPTSEPPKSDAPKIDTPKTETPSLPPVEPKTPTTPPTAPPTTDADARKAAKLPASVETLEADAKFRLVDALRNQDDRVTPAEYEMGRKLDPDLTPNKDFETLDIDKNQSLSVDEFAAGFDNLWILAAVVLATLVVPFVAAIYFCRAMRLPEYTTRVGFVLLAVTASIVIISLGHLRYGIDLKGGVVLVYQVDDAKTAQLSDNENGPDGDYMDRLIAALNLRVNPGGQKEIVIRKFGENEVEIIVPEAQPAEIEQLKKTIRTAGFLEFRIMANRRNMRKAFPTVDNLDQFIQELAKPTPEIDVQADVFNAETDRNEKATAARWFPIDTEQMNLARETGFDALILRKNLDGQDEALAILRLPYQPEELVVHGSELSSAGQTRDEEGAIAVSFRMSPVGAANLGSMTGKFPPEDNKNFLHRMGIVFDGKLISAPGLKSPISDNVIITGRYSKQDVAAMVRVLNAGSLPAVLRENPVSQNEIGATVGEDTIRKGRLAMIVSTSLVLVFMAFYYRFSGVVACMALLLNVLITFAVIILFKAPLTLPGLAGLALGVGMAVDANVLIFERIREEIDRGAALRMAIRNGFDRATTTIIDSNLTTVITGIVLYWIGTDQVKGFAVTLIVGIVANLFTAITATRLVFDIADKKRKLTKLSMSRLISGTNFDFVGKQRLCIGASVVLIVVGLVATYTRGITLLDIDFAGGTSAEVVFTENKNIDELRGQLDKNGILDATVSRIVRDDGRDVQFKIDTSLGNPSSLPVEFEKRDTNGDGKLDVGEYVAGRKGPIEEFAKKRFDQLDANGDGEIKESEFNIELEDVLHFYLEYVFEGQLQHNSLTHAAPQPIQEASASSDIRLPREASPIFTAQREPTDDRESRKPVVRLASYQTEPNEDTGDAAKQPPVAGAEESKPDAAKPADAAATPDAAAQADAAPPANEPDAASPSKATPEKATPDTTEPEKTEPSKTSSPPETSSTSPSAAGGMTTTTALTYSERLPYKQVQGALESLVKEKFPTARIRVSNPAKPGSQEASKEWVFESSLTPDETASVLDAYSAKLAAEPVFPARSNIGAAVADKAKQLAVMAVVVSLLAIIVYVWIRFQKVVYGVAAVVALVHDVLVTLGAMALSSYFVESVPALAGVLQVDAFKINLNVVAAFMTIIGFSINDTIVIFDRIRETRGKSPYLTIDMVNGSVNQMLGRTFLTSFTVLLVVGILYFFGGEAIHGFAFAMLVGLISGIYSSVFVANPIVLWMSAKPVPTKSELRSPAQVA